MVEERVQRNEDFKKLLQVEEKKVVPPPSVPKEENKVQGESSNQVKKEINPKYVLRSHMDIVRGL